MISVSAFNALLKTLEEPPAHVVFILATTEPHKIPLTIISRCQRFDFKSINNQVIVERLQEIMQHEEVDASKDALEAVALYAEGGMRDALSILDQTISYTNGKVELDDVLAVTGGISQHMLTEMTAAMYAQDTEKALSLLDTFIQNGKDPGRFVFDFIYYLRDVLFYKTTSALAGYLERAIVSEEFQQLTQEVDADWVQDALMEFTACEQQIKWTNSPKVFVEITILTVTSRTTAPTAPVADTPISTSLAVPDVDASALFERINKLEKELQELKENGVEKTGTQQAAPQQKRAASRSKGKTYAIPFERIRNVLGDAEKPALQSVQGAWANFLAQLKQTNAPAHATIQDSKPAAASAQALVIAFKYEIHCSLFLDHREMAESLLSNVLGKHLPMIPIPEEDWLTLRNEYIQQQGETEKQEEKTPDPLVEEAKKLFGEEGIQVYD